MTELIYQSTKTYTHAHGFSCCFRQWRADSHCKYLHGYALQIKLTFQGDLDERNWVQDFGGLKDVKGWLEYMFDHTTLVAKDDPAFDTLARLDVGGLLRMRAVEAVGCERFAELIFRAVEEILKLPNTRYWLESVEVAEHGGNSAIVSRKY